MAASTNKDDKYGAHFTFIWKIKHAPRFGRWESPEFIVKSMEMTKWNLIMVVFSQGGALLWIERVAEDSGPDSIEVEFELSFLDANGSSLIEKSGTGQFRREGCSQELVIPQTHAIFKERKPIFRPRDTLTVRCRMSRTRTKISKSDLCFATTHFQVYKRSCFWAIREFSSLRRYEKWTLHLNSIMEGCPNLLLAVNLTKRNGKEFIFFDLEVPNIEKYYDVEAEIALLDAEGTVFLSKRTSAALNTRSKISELSVFEKDKLTTNAAVLLSDDVLLVRCEFRLTSQPPVLNKIDGYKILHYLHLKSSDTEKKETSSEDLNEPAVCPFKEIINSFKDDKTLSDVSLRAGTVSFPVHKLILSSRSPVFKAMFTKDMKEKTSTCIDIPDMDADTLHQLLFYIYENKLQKLTWEMAANLFEAADRYGIMDLSEKCSKFLKSNLSESNVCDILVLADMHHDENLRKSVLDFIQKNSEIIYSDGWKVFKENHSKLAWETAEEIIYSMKHAKP
ncbi:TD and POZ domain-containing protein 4 [Argiope bruennichi]|uniref:TD and POZ domain-containing protein 4 n=1 Tax=Argiope bruennichi TaxID=94029 RepID=A0A8T0EEN0_ARGBR|nr:TD and POZ domain-containing protein 4 [Argiope bruennichi]